MSDPNQSSAQRQRKQADFWSRASSFSLPVGPRIGTENVEGYYIDLRVKAAAGESFDTITAAHGIYLYVYVIQWGLACYEHYLATGVEKWLDRARECGDELLKRQETTGVHAGGWVHTRPFFHTFFLEPPWLSAMAQGQGASLLVRLFEQAREERYADAARRALLPLSRDPREGGVRAMLGDSPWPEEYPTVPPSFVLNGGMFAMWGFYDVGVGLGDGDALESFKRATDSLAMNLWRWDLGYWSRYDLYPHRLTNVASSFYHDLHIKQLTAMNALAPHDELAVTSARWSEYEESQLNRRRAFLAKALFRVAEPRNSHISRMLPWSSMRRA